MACWRERVGICRRRFLPEGFVPALVFIATCLNLLPMSYAQEVFPSIDCSYLGGHYGDSRNLAGLPNYCMSIETGNSSQQPALYPSEGDVTYSCLLPVVGTRFISSVELRPLDATVYSYNGSQMRFPGDKFDGIRKFSVELPMRLPVCYLNPSDTIISIKSTRDNTTRTDVYQVPRKVTQDDWLMNDVLTNVSNFSTNRKDYGVGYYEQQAAVVFPLYSDYLYLTPAELFFSVINSRYLNSSELQTFPMEVVMNRVPGPVLNLAAQAIMQATPNFLLSLDTQAIEMSFGQSLSGQWSPASPILNAAEVSGQYDFNNSNTLSWDGFNSRKLKWVQGETGMSIKTENSSQMQPATEGARFSSSVELRPLDATMYSYSTIDSCNGSQMQCLALLFSYNLGPKNSTPSGRDPSYNAMTSLPATWVNTTLRSLDLSPYQFSMGRISSLDETILGQINSELLQVVNLTEMLTAMFFLADWSGPEPATLYTQVKRATRLQCSIPEFTTSYNSIPATFGKTTRISLAKVDGSDSEFQGLQNFLSGPYPVNRKLTFCARLSPVCKLVRTRVYVGLGPDSLLGRSGGDRKFEGLFPNDGIDSPAFELMMQKSFLSLNIKELDLSYNGIDDIETHWWDITNGLESLNLSHNEIFGEMNSFVTSMQVLQKLDLSYNAMSSLPATWGKTTLISLVVLDLSHNQLEGRTSSLDELLQMSNGSLQKLDISHNNLGGEFYSSLYFFGLQNLTTAIFYQNSIQGTLNLSAWYDKLQEVAAQKSRTRSRTRHLTRLLFSFVNNNITDIYPNAEAFEDAMEILQKRYPSFTKGILLGGNPYCKGAKSYIPRYLCRYTIYDEVPRNQKGKSYVLIIGICSGIVGLSLCCATCMTLWKLSKQVQALREIQQALADRQVHPPLYQYDVLKLATRGFHNDRKLGHGAFGAVYKGVLADETSLAVKKLFNSKQLQVLDEFLNEVVLITGIKHRNLILLKGCCINIKHRILVYEYAQKGNLAQALWGSKPHGGLNWEKRFDICVGVARGLSYLHEELQPSIVHRDIKPENILLDENFKPKVADFGLARHFSNETSQAYYTTEIAGTFGYLAPEHVSEGLLSDKGDVYSYGIVVLEIVSGRKCIDHSLPHGEIYLKDWVRKLHQRGLLIDALEPELRGTCVVAEVIRAVKIALSCVQHNPDMRPSMSQILTMFSGPLDVDIFLNEPSSIYPDVQDIMVTLSVI